MNRQLTEAGIYNICGVNGELLGQYEQKNDGYAEQAPTPLNSQSNVLAPTPLSVGEHVDRVAEDLGLGPDIVALTVSVQGMPTAGTLFLPVVLFSSSWGTLNPSSQNALLIHELLHLMSGAGDEGLSGLLGVAGGAPNPSIGITEWLVRNCPRADQ
jgi:hypothetical protein